MYWTLANFAVMVGLYAHFRATLPTPASDLERRNFLSRRLLLAAQTWILMVAGAATVLNDAVPDAVWVLFTLGGYALGLGPFLYLIYRLDRQCDEDLAATLAFQEGMTRHG